MELRPAERLILAMLAEIQEHLAVKGDTDTKFLQAALYGGHDWALEWDMPGIALVQPTSEDLAARVANILDMYDMMELSFEDLSAGEKAGLEEWQVQFRGFDGNHETEYMSTARFFVESMDRFTRFKGRDFNSHAPTVQRALSMLAVFEPLRAGTATRSGLPRLTADELKTITAAGFA